MKKALLFLSTLALVLVPVLAFAANNIRLVPDDVVQCAPYCQGCHLVSLFDSLLRAAVYFSAVIATLMFAYAGFLYVTASSNQNNIGRARDIFTKVLLGFVYVLGAWLIVNVIMNIFLDTDKIKYPWNEIKCGEYPVVSRSDLGDVRALPEGDKKIEAENRALLGLLDVGINHDNACEAGQTERCTTVAGLTPKTIGYAGDTKKQCDAVVGAPCGVVITGGSEGGHAGGTRPGSHGAGDKIDLALSDNLATYIDTRVSDGTFTAVEDPVFGREQWVDTATGAVWTLEDDHYDVCVSNCSSPAAQSE